MKMRLAIRYQLLAVAFLLVTFTAFGQQKGKDTTQQDRKYVKVGVNGLACPFCAYGLEKKLKNIEGQKDLYINIQQGYATFHVPSGSDLTKERIRKIVEEAGFQAREVSFSNQPFPKPEQ